MSVDRDHAAARAARAQALLEAVEADNASLAAALERASAAHERAAELGAYYRRDWILDHEGADALGAAAPTAVSSQDAVWNALTERDRLTRAWLAWVADALAPAPGD
ncbi:MAG: DUF4298 domain-containing protein [Thermoleophilia bacterium]|nr:DUF4298 domain-containing protein [Thermoleophilia bacterium]